MYISQYLYYTVQYSGYNHGTLHGTEIYLLIIIELPNDRDQNAFKYESKNGQSKHKPKPRQSRYKSKLRQPRYDPKRKQPCQNISKSNTLHYFNSQIIPFEN